MNQYSAIREVRRLLRAVMEQSQRPELIEQLEEIDVRLKAFHDRGIDFKEVVDGLDDSIMITDAEGTVLYINPAYTRNTEITEEDVLNRDVRSLHLYGGRGGEDSLNLYFRTFGPLRLAMGLC